MRICRSVWFAFFRSSVMRRIRSTKEGLAGQDDPHIWEAAQRTGRFLITQDLDFSDIRRFTPGTHHEILLVRLRELGREALMNRIQSIFRSEQVEGWRGCFVVVTEHKIRVRHPDRGTARGVT